MTKKLFSLIWGFNLFCFALLAINKPILFTPGPLETTATVKATALQDIGSRGQEFKNLNRDVLERLSKIANLDLNAHTIIPLSGSGTTGVEAMLGGLISRKPEAKNKLLVLANGIYGKRIHKIAQQIGIDSENIIFDEQEPICLDYLEKILKAQIDITHIAFIHLETTTGLLNPIQEITDLAKKYHKKVLIDAISSFGTIPIDISKLQINGLVFSSNKGLQALPGLTFVVANKESLLNPDNQSHSFTLDLKAQYEKIRDTQMWRFTPPTQLLLALRQSLREIEAQGGVEKKFKHTQEKFDFLVKELDSININLYLEKKHLSPVVATFKFPNKTFNFKNFYGFLKSKNFIIYPGHLTQEKTFRIGCIGNTNISDMSELTEAIKSYFEEHSEVSSALGNQVCASP